MPGMGYLWLLVALAVFAGVAWFVFAARGRRATAGGGSVYQKRTALLSPAERSFYEILRMVVGRHSHVFVKVRLADLIEVVDGAEQWQSRHNRIRAKHIDFVLCSLSTLTPFLALELDDASHRNARRRERDAFVDRALYGAGLPLLRVPAQHAYSPAEIGQLIRTAIAPRR